MSSQELFVWYRAPAEELPQVAAAARTLLHRVESACGVRGRLLQRRDERCTWMEHYRINVDAEAFRTALQAALSDWRDGLPERHSEYFEALPAAPERAP